MSEVVVFGGCSWSSLKIEELCRYRRTLTSMAVLSTCYGFLDMLILHCFITSYDFGLL